MFYTFVGKKGNEIHHIGYDKGKKFHYKESFKPSVYYEISKTSDIFALDRTPLRQKTFENLTEYYKFTNQNKDLIQLYGHIDPTHQFIAANYKSPIEFKQSDIRIWSLDIEVNSKEGFPYPFEAKWPITSISIYDSKRNEYLVFCLKDYEYDTERLPLNTNKVSVKVCQTEKELIINFIKLIQHLRPDIWIAHNGDGFDFPYIVNRTENIGLNKNDLSPIGKANSKYTEIEDKFTSGKDEYRTSIDGISLLDNLKLYKKYVSDPRESYSLSNLAVEDLNMDKLNYEEYDNLTQLYELDHTKFVDYNIVDVHLMVMLNKKRRYIDIHIRNTYKAKAANFEECMSPIKLWDIYIYHSLSEKNVQIPPLKSDVTKFAYPGAWVVEPVIDLLQWVVTFDLNSLYPHIHMQWNISPEMLVEDLTVTDWLQSLSESEIDEYIKKSKSQKQIKFLKELKELNNLGYSIIPIDREQLDDRILNKLIPTHPDYIMTANGFYFKKDDVGCIPKLLKENYAERKAIKKEMELLKAKQDKAFDDQLSGMYVAEQGIKIMMNSEYGALANEFFRYCRYELPSSITMNGQLVLKTLINALTAKYGEEIILCAGDTDSILISVAPLVKKHCNGFTADQIIDWIQTFANTEFQQLINDTYQDLSEYVGAPENYMKMSCEKIISNAFWTAKKHYAYRLVVEDGIKLNTPKFGYKGLECVKSSIPRAIRAMQKETIQTILTNKEDLYNVVNRCKEKIMALSPEDIALPKTCNGLYKYADGKGGWIKGAQAHVKAAMNYNKYVLNNKLINQYSLIKDGEKIRFVWMKQPNTLNAETFGFINRLPKDNMILDFIDYGTMYEKTYGKIIDDMCERLNIQNLLSTTNSLDDFF